MGQLYAILVASRGMQRASTALKMALSDVVTFARQPLLLTSGDTVGDGYRIVDHFGAGPLGDTYRAADPDGGLVAVKIVAPELVPTAEERGRLLAEVGKLVGQSMSRVATPIDAGVDRDAVFVISPWVKGCSLRYMLAAYRDAGKVLSPEEVLGVLEGVVEALRQLHTVIAHGAVYPESIQIAREGVVVLTDAGISVGVARARLVTRFKSFPDVAPYLPPEVCAGRRSSTGSDLYSIGVLASELLTGDPGAAAAGVAQPLLAALPGDLRSALQGLVVAQLSTRAAALPALLDGLGRALGRGQALGLSTARDERIV
jgi:serine/threonine protein kinase